MQENQENAKPANQYHVWAALVLCQVIFGIHVNTVRYATAYVDPIVLLVLRELIATIVLFTLASFSPVCAKAPPLTSEERNLCIVCGIFGVFLNMYGFAYGVQHTSAVTATFFPTTIPLFASVAAVLMNVEPIAAHRIVGFVCGVVGISIGIEIWKFLPFFPHHHYHPSQISPKEFERAATSPEGSLTSQHPDVLGYVSLLCGVASYGTYLIMLKKLLRTVPLYLALSRIFLVGLFAFVFVGLIKWHSFSALATAPFGVWLASLWAGLIVSPVPYSLNAFAVRRTSPVVVAIFSNLTPVFGSVIAVLWLHEHVYLNHVVGLVIVATGVVVSAVGEHRSAPVKEPTVQVKSSCDEGASTVV